jgi:hypothetical protein
MAYGVRERCAMIALAASGGELSNAEMGKRFKLDLDRAQRERLITDKVIASRKASNGFTHTLTDLGWRWLEDEMGQEAPKRAGSAGGALYALLGALRAPAQHAGGLRALLSRGGSPGATAQPDAKSGLLPARIRNAYTTLATRPGEWVWLRDLRARLNGAPRNDVDSALKQMYHDKLINLTLSEDQGALTREDKDAALRLGVSDMHLISIG